MTGPRQYTIRRYSPGDRPAFARLAGAARAELTGAAPPPPAGARERLCRPRFRPERDLLLAEAHPCGTVVGFLEICPEPAIGRAILDCYVDPAHRRRGLARRFLEKARARCAEAGIRASHVNIPRGHSAAKCALEKLGFWPVRRHLELELELGLTLRAPAGTPPALTLRPLEPGEEGDLASLQNRCFAGTWGYHPNSAAEIGRCLRSRRCRPEDVILAGYAGRAAGLCWTSREDGGRGRIFMLGVVPGLRGRGIGRALLQAGLRHLHAGGAPRARLTVDSRNRQAMALYRSAGFRPCGCSVWYARPNF